MNEVNLSKYQNQQLESITSVIEEFLSSDFEALALKAVNDTVK